MPNKLKAEAGDLKTVEGMHRRMRNLQNCLRKLVRVHRQSMRTESRWRMGSRKASSRMPIRPWNSTATNCRIHRLQFCSGSSRKSTTTNEKRLLYQQFLDKAGGVKTQTANNYATVLLELGDKRSG